MLNEEKRPHAANSVHLFGADGNVKKAHLVKYLSGESSSLRVDPAGNVYIASAASPAGEILPPFLQGKVSPGKLTADGQLNWYPVLYGSILKFGPAGGEQEQSRVPGAMEVVQDYGTKSYLRGALWQWHSLSPVPSHGNYSAGAYHCICAQPRFAVDDFGRVFAPDVGRFAIHVLDTNANPILQAGSYGNQDSHDEIRWAWPSLVAVSDEAIYVCDVTNRRIVRVKLAYQVEAECEVAW